MLKQENLSNVPPSNPALTKLQNKILTNMKELLNSLTFEELTELSKGIKKDKSECRMVQFVTVREMKLQTP